VRRALKELPEQPGQQAPREFRELKVLLGRKALRETLAPLVLRVYKVFKERLA
jgi:hypothetical protein